MPVGIACNDQEAVACGNERRETGERADALIKCGVLKDKEKEIKERRNAG